jgi:MarR family transcriptional regulator, organic hydroperoxide resistance regulator
MLDLLFSGQVHGCMQKACGAVGLSPGALKTLFKLEPGEGISLRELADHWGVDASYVTALADALEERGLAERRPHPTDRRVKMLVLTGKGVEARARAQELIQEPPPSFAVLTAAERRQLRDLVRKLTAADPALDTSKRPAATG